MLAVLKGRMVLNMLICMYDHNISQLLENCRNWIELSKRKNTNETRETNDILIHNRIKFLK